MMIKSETNNNFELEEEGWDMFRPASPPGIEEQELLDLQELQDIFLSPQSPVPMFQPDYMIPPSNINIETPAASVQPISMIPPPTSISPEPQQAWIPMSQPLSAIPPPASIPLETSPPPAIPLSQTSSEIPPQRSISIETTQTPIPLSQPASVIHRSSISLQATPISQPACASNQMALPMSQAACAIRPRNQMVMQLSQTACAIPGSNQMAMPISQHGCTIPPSSQTAIPMSQPAFGIPMSSNNIINDRIVKEEILDYLLDQPNTPSAPRFVQPIALAPPRLTELLRPKAAVSSGPVQAPGSLDQAHHLRGHTSDFPLRPTLGLSRPMTGGVTGATPPGRFLGQPHLKRMRPPLLLMPPSTTTTTTTRPSDKVPQGSSKNFWKAGDYNGQPGAQTAFSSGMDRVRVHPKFLHSNATSHTWALGALAELLDNSMDEISHGATYVNIDMLVNQKDGSKMLLVEDNGGGMDPDRLRQCMSLGYSVKSKSANTIGQYGNGFKTSTMRLGADVIVFSRSVGKEGGCPTQSIGLLSYTFLRKTGKEDIVVPMIDYMREGEVWNKLSRSSPDAWNDNLDRILEWSPYHSEDNLLQQFSSMIDQGTRIVIYNLWEDDQGELELDFDADSSDIQVRGVNRDEKKIRMAEQFPNSRHFLTYKHSLRSYASILYLRIPCIFRMILRGKVIDHHSIVDDMMLMQEVTYRPVAQSSANGVPMVAVVKIGFVKDAKEHIDVQGFNVYHKNRLIKPFWRIWNTASSQGRGVIGVLEANFVEPAHDKQGFERTTVLSRLETRLQEMQKAYWLTNCHEIGYVAPRRQKRLKLDAGVVGDGPSSGGVGTDQVPIRSQSEVTDATIGDGYGASIEKSRFTFQKLVDENTTLKNMLKDMEESLTREVQHWKDKTKALESEVEEANKKMEVEQHRRDVEEQSLRKKLKNSYAFIQMLRNSQSNQFIKPEPLG